MTRTPRQILAAAILCAAAFGALLGLAYEVRPARWLDAAALDGFASLGDKVHVWNAAEHVVHVFDPIPAAAREAVEHGWLLSVTDAGPMASGYFPVAPAAQAA